MANLKDLIVNGAARIIGKTYSSEFVGNVTGDLTGNAATASKLKTARSLKITDDGTNTSTGVDFDGSDTVTLKLPSTIKASLAGNASTATTADKTAYGISVKDAASNPAVDGWNGSAAKTLTIAGTSPVTTTATDGTITVTHDKMGPNETAATSGGDTADQTPGFGETFKVTSATVDEYGHTTAFTDHDVTIPSSTATVTEVGLMSADDKSKLDGIAGGAEVNQNAFSNVTVGSTTISADSKTDTLTLVAGDNITLTPDSKTVNISVTGLGTNAYSSTSYLPLSGGTLTGATTFNTYLKIKAWSGYGTGTADFWYSGNDKYVEIQNATNLKLSGVNVWKQGDLITGAVFNDLADAIPVGEGDVLEAGCCYGFDGEHYTKTSEYMQKSYIGIHSDTYGFKMGHEEGKEKLNVAVSGFVLAYVDKEYEVGTPLTCTAEGYLTEIKLEDKVKYPERVVATYWKNEPNEEWGPEGKKVRVNGRRWVKIK